MTEIVAPFQQFFDTSGAPLANGMVYIGAANLDAESNPIAVFWDEALTIPAAQPIRTLNGYPARNGAPGRLYVNADNYSITVRNAQGRAVYSIQDVSGVTSIQQQINLLNEDISEINSEISDILNDFAAPPGSDSIGFIQAGSNAIARTAQAKMRDIISVKDFGAIGNGIADDTSAIQSAINAAQPLGAIVYLPSGTYRTTATLSIDNSGDTEQFSPKASLAGDGAAATRILGAAGNFNILDIKGGTAAGVHSHQRIKGIFFEKSDAQGAVLSVDNVAFLYLDDITILQGQYGIYASDILSAALIGCEIRFCQYGLRMERINFSYPNAITLVSSVIASNANFGADIFGGTNFNMFGGSVEGNGLSGSDVNKFGVRISNPGNEGGVSGNFNGVYFELNKGQADVWLASNSTISAASFSGCSFARASSADFVTNNIYVESFGVGVRQSVSVQGCGFKRLGSYSASNARRYIASVAGGGAINSVTWSGCMFGDAVEFPDFANGAALFDEPVRLAAYSKAALPSASANEKGLIYVTDDIGGAVPAFSDGSSWRRVTDRAIIS